MLKEYLVTSGGGEEKVTFCRRNIYITSNLNLIACHKYMTLEAGSKQKLMTS